MSDKKLRTRPVHRRIAVVFDFDDTLAPDSTSGFLEWCGVDSDRFWEERVHPLVEDGWDPIPAQCQALMQVSRSGESDGTVTEERLEQYGRELKVFEGVRELFSRLRWTAQETNPDVEVEFYLVSCGIGEIIRHTGLLEEFRAAWANEFHFTEAGEIAGLKRIISHTEKTRYLFQISKGLSKQQDVGRPFAVNEELPNEKLHLPLSQMISSATASRTCRASPSSTRRRASPSASTSRARSGSGARSRISAAASASRTSPR